MLLDLLCHPKTHEPLTQQPNGLVAAGGTFFPIREGIPCLLPVQAPLRHRFWGWVYNRMAFAYDWGVAFAWRLPLGGHPIEREAYLEKIEIAPDAWVLETAVGTGANLRHLPAAAHYVGLDISLGMLKCCQKNLARWGREAALVQGDAQMLPFREGTFDAVVHMGGMQFLARPQAALAEALRVVNPGGRIWIVDEAYSIPGLARRGGGKGTASPLDTLQALVPSSATEIHAEWISNGELYFLRFRKKLR